MGNPAMWLSVGIEESLLQPAMEKAASVANVMTAPDFVVRRSTVASMWVEIEEAICD
jgi:hypothetical protein